jgi:hypothetical protein
MARTRSHSTIASEIAARVSASPDFSVAGLRPLRRQVSLELHSHDPDLVIRIALLLVERDTVPRWFAFELLNHHPALAVLQRRDVERLGSRGNVGDVDAFATYISVQPFARASSRRRRFAVGQNRTIAGGVEPLWSALCPEFNRAWWQR